METTRTAITETSYKELFSLKGKTAIVRGGFGILGTRFCWGLAEFGANVAIVDNAGASMYELARELSENHGVKAVGIECDIASQDSVRAMVQTVVEALEDIHILLNNAQGHYADPAAALATFEEYRLGEWRSSMSVNVDGYFLVAQAVGNQMLAQKTAGSIIQTASIYGLMAPDQRI